ncbi:hypothetical protein TRICI_004479 [Trichomonascus ciferrii]|uniref:Splicing factor U2AF 23 kDa subunit n=1 Tax=Trichomonascus ciferrii TaxID=44093 RepID=A0A642V0J0_9ASCO|nr:hypothetical protein TRICI_004479 [Trichomonascus ciferrii]
MATYLASIYGTEHDKVNCSFYYKIGACRHGDKCSRKHVKPTYSQTLICRNMYQDPSLIRGNTQSAGEMQEQFEAFYEDFYCEAALFGKLEEMVVCENTNDHLKGNVYARFKYEEDAQKAMDNFNSRWYGGRPIYCELSPVTDFKEACCRQHESRDCNRGGYCNFMHAKRPPQRLLRELESSQKKYIEKHGKDERSDSESPSPDRERRRHR